MGILQTIQGLQCSTGLIFFFLREVNNLYKRKTLNISFFRVEVEMQGLDYGCALDYTPQPSLFFYDEQ